MLQIFVLFLIQTLCFAAIEDLKIYKNEVSVTVEEHIISKSLALLEAGYDYRGVATQLAANLNQTYGNGWQCLTGYNVDFSTLSLTHESNTLFYFSFKENHIYVFKQSVNPSNCSVQSNIQNVTKAAQTAAPFVMSESLSNTTLRSVILNATQNALHSLNSSCNFDLYDNQGSSCLRKVGDSIINVLVSNNKNQWTISVGEKHSEFMTWSNPANYILYKFGDLYFTVVEYTSLR